MGTPQEKLEATIESLTCEFNEQLRVHAHSVNTTQDALLKAVIANLLGEDYRADGRAHMWRARLRLYDYSRPLDEPEADSDEPLTPDRPGETVHRGLPAVISWIAELASKYHGAPCAGLDSMSLRRKLKTLRTMMAYRKDGTGTLRADYQVLENGCIRHMLARCDVQRADGAIEEEVRKMPRIVRN